MQAHLNTETPAGVEIFGVPGNPVTQAGKWKKCQVKQAVDYSGMKQDEAS